MIDPGLSGKVALVTGANHGIGAATARALAAQGAAVFIHYLRLPPTLITGEQAAHEAADEPGEDRYRLIQAEGADAVVAAIRTAGGRVDAWEADLAEPATIPLIFDRVQAALGPVDVLVNNAAHCVPDTLLPQNVLAPDDRSPGGFSMATLTGALHDQHFAVNTRAVALMMVEYARRHIARGARWGLIVNISTDGAYAFAGEVSYGASKNALEAYSRSAAHELGRYGITVNIVSPGPVQTGWMSPDVERAAVASIPLGRVGRPEDVADVIVFLASEQARWLTGQTLHVGGGHRM